MLKKKNSRIIRLNSSNHKSNKNKNIKSRIKNNKTKILKVRLKHLRNDYKTNYDDITRSSNEFIHFKNDDKQQLIINLILIVIRILFYSL